MGWSIYDINNMEGADRKLCINEVMEFWVHDEVLAQNSGYFRELFGMVVTTDAAEKERNKSGYPDQEKEETKQGPREEHRSDAYGRPRTSLSLPHHECFYDVLTWMYAKDK